MDLMKPSVDYVFKKIFGNPEKPDILISFLNGILNCPPDNLITSVEILNPENDIDYIKQKFSILDVKARTNRNELVDIEIQVAKVSDMPERVIFYLSQLLSSQLKAKDEEEMRLVREYFQDGTQVPGEAEKNDVQDSVEITNNEDNENSPTSQVQREKQPRKRHKYTELDRAVGIILLDFTLEALEQEAYHSVFRFASEKTGISLTDMIEAHFIELPKFGKYQEEWGNEKLGELWLEFIKRPDSKIIGEKKSALRPISHAVEELTRLSFDVNEREIYENRRRALRNEASSLETERAEGKAEGMAEGIEIGKVEIQRAVIIQSYDTLKEILTDERMLLEKVSTITQCPLAFCRTILSEAGLI